MHYVFTVHTHNCSNAKHDVEEETPLSIVYHHRGSTKNIKNIQVYSKLLK